MRRKHERGPAVTYSIVWEFRVPLERVPDFEAAYGPDGGWARLFSRAVGFIGVELLRCTQQEGRYLTIDRWESRAVFEAFHAQFAAEYKELDASFESLASAETRVGAFVRAGRSASGES
jgi:heme-degrading monooxygenase HmoA